MGNEAPSSRPSRTRIWLIPSRLDAVDDICHQARQFLVEQGLCACSFSVDLVLRESLNNSILHGHRGDSRKQVQATMRIGRRWIQIHIADQGPGFNWRKALQRPPDDTAPSGRGLAILKLYTDHLRFNRAGNTVTLWIALPHLSKNKTTP